MNTIIKRSALIEHLPTALFSNHTPIKVVFTKSDGSLREMLCTTNLDLVPPSQWPNGDRKDWQPIQESVGVKALRVFDTQIQEWRSFRLQSVLEVFDSATNNLYKIRD